MQLKNLQGHEKNFHKAVQEQLRRLLDSKDFKASPRLKNFLAFIVEETVSGRAGNIKAYNIAISVFGRNERFDPMLDSIVRVEAGKLRQRLERYYLLNPDDPLTITIPLGSYVPVFALGQKKNQNKATPESASSGPHQNTNAKVNSASSLPSTQANEEASFFQADVKQADFAPQKATFSAPQHFKREQRPVLAILPFSRAKDDQNLDSFLTGLTAGLLVQMSYNQDVDVRETPGTMVDESKPVDVTSIAENLGARFILHGQAQCLGDAVRVYVALTDASTASRLWTEKFDSLLTPEGLLEAQDKITRKVAAWVADSFGLINRTLMRESSHKQLDEMGTYEATLRYHTWVTTFSRDDYIAAKEALERSSNVDPGNVVIYSLLSDIYSSDYQFGYDLVKNSLEQALGLAKKALSLDATCHMAHWALAFNYFLRCNRSQMEIALSQLSSLSPANPYITVSLGLIIGMSRNLEEGKKLMEDAALLNPHSPSWLHVVPFIYHYNNKDYEKALGEALQMNTPACIWEPILRAAAYASLNRKKEAKEAWQRLQFLEPNFKKKQERILYALFFDARWVDQISKGLAAAAQA